VRVRKIIPELQRDERKDTGLRSGIHQDNLFVPIHESCMQDGGLRLGIPRSEINRVSLRLKRPEALIENKQVKL